MKRIPMMLPWLIAVAGCSGPPVGAVRDSGQEFADVGFADAGVDVVEVADALVIVDAGSPEVAMVDAPDVVDVTASDMVDASAPDVVVADAPDVVSVDILDVVMVDVPDVVDAGTPDSGPADAGPITMQFEFVSSTPTGQSGGVSMQSVIVWHGSHRGSAGGISFEGWFQ